MATVTNMTVCVIARLEKPAAIRVQHLLSRNIRIEEDLVDQLFNSSEKRPARVLLLLQTSGRKLHLT
jgi:CRP/FNR family cyclic AMP-dependent transcriptional regulator